MGVLAVDRERHFPQMHIKLVVEGFFALRANLNCSKWPRGCVHPAEPRSGSPEPWDHILSRLVAKDSWALQ